MEGIVLGVSDFVAYLNQTLEAVYPYVEVEGELSNFRVSKNKWVYFDLKDEAASLKCFATVYSMPGPLEDGMVVRVAGSPRLHPLYNFSFQVQSIAPVGEGSLRRAADLLAAKLDAEGLFDESRKRSLPFPPERIALITAGGSAAYADFVKIAAERWGGLEIEHYDVLVQGEQSPSQIVGALERINKAAELPDVVVLIRGGGSTEDLAAFSDERVVRAVAGSRVPTLVAIGHEVDLSLAELAADRRASTPSNAAELLLPDKNSELRHVMQARHRLDESIRAAVYSQLQAVTQGKRALDQGLLMVFRTNREHLARLQGLIGALSPLRPLRQGYAVVRYGGRLVRSARKLSAGEDIEVKFIDGKVISQVKQIKMLNSERMK